MFLGNFPLHLVGTELFIVFLTFFFFFNFCKVNSSTSSFISDLSKLSLSYFFLSGVLTCQTFIFELSISLLNSISLCFMYLGALLLGAYMFIFVVTF